MQAERAHASGPFGVNDTGDGMNVEHDFCEGVKEYFDKEGFVAPLVRLEKGQFLYTCGARDSSIYVVVDGRAKTLGLTSSGKTCFLDIHLPGDLFGESCLVLGERTETAVAMASHTILHRFPREHFLQALAAKGLDVQFMQHLARNCYEQQKRIAQLVTMGSQQRLAEALLRLAHRAGVGNGDVVRINCRVTQGELAEMVGTTRSRIGYFLKNFRDERIIYMTGDRKLAVNTRKVNTYLQLASLS
ncbi:Crp/Fnr family transcriptional regulator [Streptomyces sp. BE147]|uniref:Crp/Fnr family transcriptional regulator n=1 Tax=unclassified Streptomyces TaxID=2593676 RepID=UPI002E78D423|nr:Crp/Fnr family transcriptional regulator [Streptomyces sp. BE147]MEE1741508.1 Crp/Fnr family transcriptional regulator [Streptomyces sp. BE147]